jgi:tellurite resistance protein TerC
VPSESGRSRRRGVARTEWPAFSKLRTPGERATPAPRVRIVSGVGRHASWVWASFAGTLLVLLAIDLFAHRGRRALSRKAAIAWSVVWIAAGLSYGGFLGVVLGGRAAGEYLAAWLIEKSLSVDNLFVFLIVFQALKIPEEKQRRVLTWGIFGALVFRALFVAVGAAALERFHWVTWLFGAILLWTAVRVFREDPAKHRESRAVRWLSRHLPVSKETGGGAFLAREGGRRVATPLLVALLAIEVTDLVFAIDSIPAAFSVTRDTFLVYASNAFAILGLRSLYAVLAHGLERLRYLHYALAGVLAFAGVKIIVARWVELPPWISIAVVVAVIGAAVWASLKLGPREAMGSRSVTATRSSEA